MTLELRAIADDEVEAYRACLMTTFGHDAAEAEPAGDARLRAMVQPGQAWAAFDHGQVVATAGTFDLAIGAPGGESLRMAGLTMVTVRPTHRRRGLLRSLMQLHLDDARAKGYPVSGLWASEGTIYGRYGYGVAAHGDEVAIDNAHALAFTVPADDAIDWLDDAAARAELPATYARATAARPGALRRAETWWRERRFLEAPFMRGGASRLRHVIARRGGAAVGYLAFRQRPAFEHGLPGGTIQIVELIAVDARAEASLWRFACSIDLFPRVRWGNAPLDAALPWIVDNPRAVRRTRADTLWIRIEDLAGALAARRYLIDGTLRFAVDDTAWQLVVRDGRGHCEPTADAPELRLSRAQLGTLSLGGTTASQLARAGLVTGDAAAIVRADQLFASAIAPWCPEVF